MTKKLELRRRLLLVVLLRRLLLGTLQASAEVANRRDVLLQEGIHVGLLLDVGDLARGLSSGNRDGADGTSAVAGAVLDSSLGLSLGGLLRAESLVVDREEHKLACVRLQALNVGLEALLAQVLSALVDADANRGGVLRVQLRTLQLLDREATAQALLGVVADSRAVHLWAESLEWTREDLLGLQQTQAATAVLLCRLVEEHLDVTLLRRARVEVLLLMHMGDGVVSLGHFLGTSSSIT